MRRVIHLKLKTDGSGDAVAQTNFYGELLAVDVAIGDMTTPDIDITEEPAGTSVLSVTGLAADTRYLPAAESADTDGSALGSYAHPVILGKLQVAVSGGGATKSGTVRLLVDY